ncbi:osmoprotectant transport system permease protein [Sagittula marina]|uniref:Osmoprotectant transport system permease protein n=1 Tax=Sagittula marina TaxID=943940 RepID=A0A7W6DVR3_9RHOB|nr:ABC transporter permease [Sagittula marina]MBB3987525.1 osmoprotectant transport system permease protein [Sagittula marina]
MRAVSPPGLVFAIVGGALLCVPFMTLAANRIVAGHGVMVWALGYWPALMGMIAALGAGLSPRPTLRLFAGALGLACITAQVSQGADLLLADAGDYARTSPAAGFWGLLAVFSLLIADALTQLHPRPLLRAGLLIVALAALAVVFWSGLLGDLSIAQEYVSRARQFWTALAQHLQLALGSLAVAVVIGFPLGVLCHRRGGLRRAMLPMLSFLQTIPSLAMFGIMIPLLAWVATTVPGAREIGIAGIGFAPAFVALVLYSLLPVVGNTVAGLDAVPPATSDAARGMGLSATQQLWQVELPLGLPVLLTGVRIVMVQNIGLAVIAGLIGGGGFGSFVFQGLNQTATDLILLGALPTVLLALVAAVLMDILVDLARPVSETAR